MIQRIQSLFFLFASVALLVICYYFPVLSSEEGVSYFIFDYNILYLLIILSSIISMIALFYYKNRKKQLLLSHLARLNITIILVLIVFLYQETKIIDIGLFLLVIPFLSLIIANYFVRKDQKLVEAADRLR